MPIAEVLLGVLADRPAHGYDLKAEHDARFPASRALAYGQVYATLTRLQRAEMVETIETRQGAGPERTVYAITSAGTSALETWLAQTEEPSPQVADELLRKTITALHAPGDAGDFLRRQREVHLHAMRQLTARLQEAATVEEQIGIDLAVAHLDAELRWLDNARARIRAARHPLAGPDGGSDRGRTATTGGTRDD